MVGEVVYQDAIPSTTRPNGISSGGAADPQRRLRLISILATQLQKYPEKLDGFQQRVREKKPLLLKDVLFEVDVIREAVQRATGGRRELAKVDLTTGGSSSSGATGARWTPRGPSAATMHAKAQLECERAEAWHQQVQVMGGCKLAILTRPDVLTQPSGRYLMDGEVVEVVARTVSVKDGRTYLRLQKQDGWICTRSRKDFTKQVIKPQTDDVQMEPVGCEPPESLAKQMLEPMDDMGKRALLLDLEDKASRDAARQPQQFTVLATQCPILQSPSSFSSSKGVLAQREVFTADGTFFSMGEHRAYLHMQDGRGWISECKKSDFRRLAVAPVGCSDAQLEVATSGQRVQAARVRRPSAPVTIPTFSEGPSLPKQVREKMPKLSEGPCIFPSDKELWPESLCAPQPLTVALRAKLRTVRGKYGDIICQGQADAMEATEKANGYARSCATEKALRDLAKAIDKEVARVQSDWADDVKLVLAEEGLDWNSSAPKPPDGEKELRVSPVQVCGKRLYCALLDEGGAEEEHESETSSQRRLLGPLREAESQAQQDLEGMRGARQAKKRR
mmetsp:Transcript_29227/g.67282  ORF Transcript_29227/g.67282 Transcript_29227/m.67282 type:complete len:562 (-) Transcript_29227:101-1786(-)